MFYPPQFVTEQFQQEEQQRRELQQLLHQQSLLLSTPPLSPMSATLGHPNRSCASCKKRKVKCDRKTPSCTACQKSKHRCQYTSYSPPVLTDEPQQPNEDEGIKAIKRKIEELDTITKQRWEQFQKMMAAAVVTKNERELGYANPSGYYNNMEEEEVVFFNPAIPTSTGATQYTLQQQQNSPQQLQQLQIPQQQPTVSYLLSPQQQYQQSSAETSPYLQTQNLVMTPGSYTPYMVGTIVLNYNVNAMRSFLGRQVAQLLQSMTGGQGPNIPPTGFNNIAQLQEWLKEKFLSQDWTEELESYDLDERIELRPIYEEVNNQQFPLRQKFEVILHQAEFSSSPSSVHGDSFHYNDFEEKNHMEMENLTSYSETGSNRSSIIDLDPSDVFLNKIYAFVRRFIRNHPWLRENFLANLRERSSPLETYDGVFSDVVVEVRKVGPSYNAFQDLKLIQNPQDLMTTKGRLSFF